MAKIEKVELNDLKTGDQIAVVGDVADLNEALAAFTCIIDGGNNYFHHAIYDEENKTVIELHGDTKDNAVPKRRPFLQFFCGP